MPIRDKSQKRRYQQQYYKKHRDTALLRARQQHEAQKDSPEYKAKKAAYKKEWYQKNRQRVKVQRQKYYAENRDAIRIKNAEWHEANKAHHHRKIGDAMRRRLYGVSREQYDQTLARQAGRCAICRTRPRSTELCQDHDHITGQARGILCQHCNKGLYWVEKPEWLREAQAYLGRYPWPQDQLQSERS